MTEPGDHIFDSELSEWNVFKEVDFDDVELVFGDLEEGEAKEMKRRIRVEVRGASNATLVFRKMAEVDDEEIEHMERWVAKATLGRKRAFSSVLSKGNGKEAMCKVKAEIDKCVGFDVETGLQLSREQPVRHHKIYFNLVKEYTQALAGGCQRLQHFYGEKSIVFHVEAGPRSIVIKTSDDKFAKAKSLLFQKKPEKDLDVSECPICAEESELLKIPGCNHTICETCLNAYCTNDAADRLPLLCFSSPKCDALLKTHWLEQHLPPISFRSLLKTIITSHCQQKPEEFIRMAPDCDQRQYLATSKKFNKVI